MDFFNVDSDERPNDDEIDVSHLRDNEHKERLLALIGNYKPKKTKLTDIKMKILLKTKKPICLRPRRLPETF